MLDGALREKNMSELLYFEDFKPGQQFPGGGTYTITKEELIKFAREFDPQAQHVDEKKAKHSQFGELVASGWHTGGASMRLKIDSNMAKVAGGLVGLGIENMRWPRPVKAGDTLRILITILETRASSSKPDKGIIKYRIETFNQRGELVMDMVTSAMVSRRNKDKIN